MERIESGEEERGRDRAERRKIERATFYFIPSIVVYYLFGISY